MGKKQILKAIDLFAGAGGMSSGLVAAGFRVVAAVERNADAADSYRANHKDVEVYEADISTLSPRKILKDLGLKPGELDVLAGCPPCQGFTRLTEKNGKRDPRNTLVREYVRFVEVMKPRACMFENVPGLETRGKRLFAELKAALELAGYELSYEVLQLADYGVPQFRRRLVLLAGRDASIKIPERTHAAPSTAKEEKLRPWKTVAQAIGNLPSPPLRSAVRAPLDSERSPRTCAFPLDDGRTTDGAERSLRWL